MPENDNKPKSETKEGVGKKIGKFYEEHRTPCNVGVGLLLFGLGAAAGYSVGKKSSSKKK